MGRDRGENARAARRVGAEGAEPIEDVAALLGESAAKVIRWAVRGHRGVHLDARTAAGRWYSSTPAALRFVRALWEMDEADREAGH